MSSSRKLKGYVFLDTAKFEYYLAVRRGFTYTKSEACVYSMDEINKYTRTQHCWGLKEQGKWREVYE